MTSPPFHLVPFIVAGHHRLTGPRWHRLTAAQVERLLGQPADSSRGDGYQPPPAEPEEIPLYGIIPVADPAPAAPDGATTSRKAITLSFPSCRVPQRHEHGCAGAPQPSSTTAFWRRLLVRHHGQSQPALGGSENREDSR